jgi:hypothetical protein
MEPEILYRTHKCPPPVPILSQLHPVPTAPSNFLKTNLNIIFPSTSGSPQLPLSLRFPHHHPVPHCGNIIQVIFMVTTLLTTFHISFI